MLVCVLINPHNKFFLLLVPRNLVLAILSKTNFLCIHYSGVCTQSPVYAIIMEYCAYGALHQLLKEGSKIITPSRVVSWSKQIGKNKFLSSMKFSRLGHEDSDFSGYGK